MGTPLCADCRKPEDATRPTHVFGTMTDSPIHRPDMLTVGYGGAEPQEAVWAYSHPDSPDFSNHPFKKIQQSEDREKVS